MGRAEAAQGDPELRGAQERGPVRDGVEQQEGVGRLQEVLLGPVAVALQRDGESGGGGTIGAGEGVAPPSTPPHLHVPRVQQRHSRRFSVHFHLSLTHFI